MSACILWICPIHRERRQQWRKKARRNNNNKIYRWNDGYKRNREPNQTEPNCLCTSYFVFCILCAMHSTFALGFGFAFSGAGGAAAAAVAIALVRNRIVCYCKQRCEHSAMRSVYSICHIHFIFKPILSFLSWCGSLLLSFFRRCCVWFVYLPCVSCVHGPIVSWPLLLWPPPPTPPMLPALLCRTYIHGIGLKCVLAERASERAKEIRQIKRGLCMHNTSKKQQQHEQTESTVHTHTHIPLKV